MAKEMRMKVWMELGKEISMELGEGGKEGLEFGVEHIKPPYGCVQWWDECLMMARERHILRYRGSLSSTYNIAIEYSATICWRERS